MSSKNSKNHFKKGEVKWFDPTKGFGFIIENETQDEILLHINTLRDFGLSTIGKECRVEFELEASERGLRVSKIHSLEKPNKTLQYIDLSNEEKEALQPACVKWFDHAKGYGFVETFGENEEVFVHAEILRSFDMLNIVPGQAVAVVIERQGKEKQVSVLQPWKFRPGK